MAKKLSNLTEALLETAEDMHRAGMIGENTYRTITARHLGRDGSGLGHILDKVLDRPLEADELPEG